MKSLIIAGVLALAAGVAGLAYASFRHGPDPNEPTIAAIEVSAQQQETVGSPVWIGLAVIAAGGLLLLMDNKQA